MIDPAHFSSEVILVEPFFTHNLTLRKIEMCFTVSNRALISRCIYLLYSETQAPVLCDSQVANYTIVFTERASGDTWQAVSQPLREAGETVAEIEVGWFELDKSYNATVTISTALGNVSSSTEFGRSHINTCELYLDVFEGSISSECDFRLHFLLK